MGATWAQDETDIDRLAAAVVSPVREMPIVCVTKQSYVSSPLIDVEALAVELEGLADVWVIGRSSLGWGLTERLPAGLDVWGGRVRVWWPIADLDAINPADHRGFSVFDRDDGARVKAELVAYVRRMSVTPLMIGEELEATVGAVLAHGAEFELRDGFRGFAANPHLSRGPIVYASEAVTTGQRVRVRVTGEPPPGRDTFQLTLRPFAPEPWERIAAVYAPGMTVEGLVSEIRPSGAFVELLPGVRGLVHTSKISGGWVDDPGDFVAVEELVAVRILALDPVARTAELSMRDVTDDDPLEPVASIYPGGPPWIGPVAPNEPALESGPEDGPRLVTDSDLAPAVDPPVETVAPDVLAPEPAAIDAVPDRAPAPPDESREIQPEPTAVTADEELAAEPSMDLDPQIGELATATATAVEAQEQLRATARAAERTLAEVRADARALIREIETEIASAEQRVLRIGRDEVAAIVGEAQEASRHLRERVDQLRGQLEGAVAERGELIAAVGASKQNLARERDRRTAAEKAATVAAQRAATLQAQLDVIDGGDPTAKFVRELHYAYTRSYTSEDDRRRYPFDAPIIGPAFLASVDKLDGIQRSRVLEVCLHVAVGRAFEILGLEIHQLRESAAGDAPFRIRATDGAVAWRVSLQVKTPSARRLHYWQLRDGRIELSKVGTHDDVTIV